MSLFPHTVTIFNKYERDNKVYYSRVILSGVQFVLDEVNARKTTGSSKDDKVTCYIPRNVKANKSYVDSFTFKNDETVNVDTTYTISKEDLIGFGVIDLDGLTINDYRNNRGSLYEITAISDYQFGSNLDNKVIVAK